MFLLRSNILIYSLWIYVFHDDKWGRDQMEKSKGMFQRRVCHIRSDSQCPNQTSVTSPRKKSSPQPTGNPPLPKLSILTTFYTHHHTFSGWARKLHEDAEQGRLHPYTTIMLALSDRFSYEWFFSIQELNSCVYDFLICSTFFQHFIWPIYF